MSHDLTLAGRLPGVAAEAGPDWDALYAELLPRVHDFFRYRVGTGPEAEDLTSVTFAKAWAARQRYRRDVASFPTWVFAIARNVAVDHFRARRPLAPIEAALDLPGGESPDEAAERRANEEWLLARLAALPDRERELVALKFGAGLTNREIARATSLSETNVGTILHRTVALLREQWNEGDPR